MASRSENFVCEKFLFISCTYLLLLFPTRTRDLPHHLSYLRGKAGRRPAEASCASALQECSVPRSPSRLTLLVRACSLSKLASMPSSRHSMRASGPLSFVTPSRRLSASPSEEELPSRFCLEMQSSSLFSISLNRWVNCFLFFLPPDRIFSQPLQRLDLVPQTQLQSQQVSLLQGDIIGQWRR